MADDGEGVGHEMHAPAHGLAKKRAAARGASRRILYIRKRFVVWEYTSHDLRCFWCAFSVSFFLRTLAGPRRLWSPTWPQLGSILEPCWPLFGTFLGVVVASSFKMRF